VPTVLTQVVYAFEAAHRKGETPRVQDFVPHDAANRPTIAGELTRVDLEYRRKRGLAVSLDAYLTPFPELQQDEELLLDVIEAEYRDRERRGERPDAATYGRQFPHLSARLTARLQQPANAASGAGPPELPNVPGYDVLSVLGEGGMGIVYQARHLKLKRTVALKMIRGGTQVGADDLQRFRTEAEAVARLQHPNVVQILEVGECAGQPFFTLEYCAGGSLDRKLAGTPLPARDAARLAETLARAVAAAHAERIVHRDLKPHNVLLTADGTPKVTDFGLAKRLDAGGQQTHSGALVGTPSYMAPEQARGDLKAVGPLADVYALGAILYEMLTGRPPFKAATPIDTAFQVLSDDPVPPRRLQSKTPRDLETICLKCLHKEPARRYAGALELAQDLERFLQGQPIQARPIGLIERSWRLCRQHRAKVGLTAAAVLLVLGTLVGGLWYQGERGRRQAELNQGVRAELDKADGALRQLHQNLDDPRRAHELLSDLGKWERQLRLAEDAWARADRLAAGAAEALDGATADHLRQLAERLKGEQQALALAGKLDAVRLEAATLVDGKFDPMVASRKYPKVFADAQVDATKGEIDAAASRMVGSPARFALVAALDHWARVTRDEQLRARLLTIARKADPDPWRDRLRDAQVWDDAATLQQLEGEVRVREQSPHILTALAHLLHAQGKDPAPLLRRAVASYPRDFWLYYDLGIYATDETMKIVWFQAALVVRPESSPARLNLGAILHARGDAAAALAHYEQILEANPTYANVHYNLAIVLKAEKKLDEAIAHYRKAIQCNPGFAAAHNNLGSALYARGDLAEAIQHYEKAVAIKPAFAQAHFNLGNALQDKKDTKRAIKHYQQAIAVDDTDADMHHNLGLALESDGNPDEAIAAYHRAIKRNPKMAMSYYNLGGVLIDQGQFAAAAEMTRRYLAMTPADAQYRSNAEWRLAKCAQLLTWDGKLNAYLSRGELPKQPNEQMALAIVCWNYKHYHASAARLYAAAFDALPGLLLFNPEQRYRAARCALLAAAGKSREPVQPTAAEKTWLRAQALTWLREELRRWTVKLKKGDDRSLLELAQSLSDWQFDPALTITRAAPERGKLPAEEQTAWEQLWAEAGQLLGQVPGTVRSRPLPGTLTAEKREIVHPVELRAGQVYQIDLESREFDAFLRLEDGQGNKLAENDDRGRDTLDARLFFTPEADGTYRLVATSAQQRGTGAYTLTIRQFVRGKQ
jgi:serine/threonine-protein kinase